MPMENQNYIMREITPLSERDCFYIADRRKTEFTYPIHCHAEYELNFTEHASGVRRVVGDSAEIIGDYDLVLITGKELEHVWEQHEYLRGYSGDYHSVLSRLVLRERCQQEPVRQYPSDAGACTVRT